MKTIFIPAEERLESLYSIAGASGSNIYEEIAEEYSVALRIEHGKHIDIEYEAISPKDMKELLAYLEEEEY